MSTYDLTPHFQAVSQVLASHRTALNQADTWNGNHGDHMVEIFAVVSRIVREQPAGDLAGVLDSASQALALLPLNGSARVYSQGLAAFARQFHGYGISIDDLIGYIRSALGEHTRLERTAGAKDTVLTAVVAGLKEWKTSQSSLPAEPGEHVTSAGDLPHKSKTRLDLGFLFELGAAYLQAQQHNSDRLSAFAETAVSVCPLGQVPHRRQSGKLVFQTLLINMLD